MATQSTSAMIAGPRDRESFFDAQRRNRRATWRLSVVCVLSTIIMGIPLALTITPLLYAFGLLIADIVNIWMPLPMSFWQRSNEFARYGILTIEWLTQHQAANSQAVLIGAAVLLLPGAILSLGLWMGMNALFRRAGAGGALLALKAREPNPSELKELKLSDVVQEMAIAAGIPAPKIMLIDAPAANAAAIGSSPDDARIVVTRGLMEQFNRDELEGALAHLIASIGNGDLRIAFRVTSVFETCGLLLALINAPFGSESRRTLWRIVRYGFAAGKHSAAGAEESAAVAALLSRSTDLATDDIDRMFDSASRKKSVLRSIRDFLLFPIFFTNFAVKLSLWFFSFTMLTPSMALLWRKRKYLADASAVQLTRNPDGLAEALRRLNADRGPIPGGAWAAHLFLVNPTGGDRMNDLKANADRQQMLAQMWAASAANGSVNPPAPPPSPTCAYLPSAAPPATAAPLPFPASDIIATGQAALAGDQNAVARMMAFRQAAATALGKPVEELPNISDLAAAQHGDKAAIQHLQQFSKKTKTNQTPAGDSDRSSEAANSNFAGFFPSLKRRFERLDRMGAHVKLEATDRKAWIVYAVLSLLFAPFALVLLALFLLLISILVLSSLAFLAVWMAFIHQIFVIFVHH